MKQVLQFFDRKVTKPSVTQWFKYFRDICTTHFSNFPFYFNNVTVHLDETFIGGKHKYGKGRKPKCKQRYLFGIIDNVHHKAYVQFVKKKDRRTIIPIIENKIVQGCTIHSDAAAIYHILGNLNYNHYTVVHERNYVDPITGVHSNWIENFWANMKMKFKSIHGSQKKS